MPHSSLAIANGFLALPNATETVTQMKLQKLAFIANGWNMAINGEPLIAESAEAWTYGPVYRELYDHTKSFGKAPIGRLITPDDSEPVRVFMSNMRTGAAPYKARLTPREASVIDNVWRRYGSLSGIRLSELTHQRGTPWYETYMNRGKNAVIDEELIRHHYEQLAQNAVRATA